MTDAPIRFLLHPSPVGDVLIAGTDAGLVTLHPLRDPLGQEQERLSRALHTVLEHVDDDPRLTTAARQLDEYFDGERHDFALELDWRLVRGFTRAALEAVRGIPYGETAGYGDVAVLAGSPGPRARSAPRARRRRSRSWCRCTGSSAPTGRSASTAGTRR